MLEKKLSEKLINYIASSIIVYLTPDCCICFHFAETESVIVSSHRTMSSEYSRLPPDIRPSHYKLRLEPNFETFKFNGSVDITVDPGGDGEISEIAINANKLVIHSLSVKRSIVTSKDVSNESADDSDGETESKRAKRTTESEENVWSLVSTKCQDIATSFELLEQEEVILIKFPEPLTRSGSPLLISILYTGELDDSMRGLYRTQHKVARSRLGNNETRRWGAACHFEATGARKCFPCFDQPEFRSTFDIHLWSGRTRGWRCSPTWASRRRSGTR